MERLFDIFLWAMAGACGLVVPGALFGAMVRGIAWQRGEAHEPTLSSAVGQGLWSGGLFLGAIGFLAGALVGFLNLDLQSGMVLLGQVVGSVIGLMLLAALAGGLTLFLFWLGPRATGMLLGVTVVLGFGGVVAWKKGVALPVVVVTLAGLGIATLIVMVVAWLLAPLAPAAQAREVVLPDEDVFQRFQPSPSESSEAIQRRQNEIKRSSGRRNADPNSTADGAT